MVTPTSSNTALSQIMIGRHLAEVTTLVALLALTVGVLASFGVGPSLSALGIVVT
ncbi:MAG: hypothetical protein KR126chlam2_01405, partial [Chlamydiae bacterium]|nr:hypothetical protein [Chlamydiota bacterium]